MKVNLTDAQIEKLGKVPDKVLAKELGVPVQAIFAERSSRKISPHRKHSVVAFKKLDEDALQKLVDDLGKQRDSVLARTFGVSREYVRQLRERHNVPKYSKYLQSVSPN